MIQEEELTKLKDEDEEELEGGVSDESLDEVLDEEDDEDLDEAGSGDEFGDDGKEELGAW